jgi:hypothetical protein
MTIIGRPWPSPRRQSGGLRTLAIVVVGLLVAAAIFLQDRGHSRLVAADPSLPSTVTTSAGIQDRKALNLACNRGDMLACRWIFGEQFDAGHRKEALTLLAAMVKRLKGVTVGRHGEKEELIYLREAAEALLATKDDASELSPAQRAELGLDASALLAAAAAQAERRKIESGGLNVLVRSAPGKVPAELRVEQRGDHMVVSSRSDHQLMVAISSFFPVRNAAGEIVAQEGCYWGLPDSKKRGAEEYIVFAPGQVRTLDFFADCGTERGRDVSSVPLHFGVYDYATKLWIFATKLQ